MIDKLVEKYKNEVIVQMMKDFDYKNPMAVPKISKVIINTGFGKLIAGKSSSDQKKIYGPILNDLSQITGQRLILTRAKKSISGFKIRKGMPLGAKATLRGKKMYDFLERLIHVALPRARDFRGISEESFDKEGNMTIGIKEHIAFPEISPETAKQIFGFQIIVVTTAKDKEKGIKLLKLLGFPIKSKE